MKTVERDPVATRRFEGAAKEMEEEYASEERPPLSLFSSIHRVIATTVAVLESRIELLVVEMKELRGHAFSLIAWGLALVFLGFLAVVALMMTIVFLLWSQAQAVLIGFSVFFVVLAIGSLLAAKSHLRKIPFSDTVDQLRKDRELLSKKF